RDQHDVPHDVVATAAHQPPAYVRGGGRGEHRRTTRLRVRGSLLFHEGPPAAVFRAIMQGADQGAPRETGRLWRPGPPPVRRAAVSARWRIGERGSLAATGVQLRIVRCGRVE